MRKAKVFVQGVEAGILEEVTRGQNYHFIYRKDYKAQPISLTMPTTTSSYEFRTFPPFFEGLLPEGVQLEGLLRLRKIDKNDFLQQLISVGQDLIGAVTVEECASDE